jgi:DNA-binding MarR family transcriptional regulator
MVPADPQMNPNTPQDSARKYLDEAQARSLLLSRPGFLIRRLHQIHCSLFLEETREFNVTPVQYSLLTALGQFGELEQGRLALEIGLERTSVAEVIPRLAERGLIERCPAPEDKRVKRVRLTRKGRNLLTRIADRAQRAHDRTVECLEADEREAFLTQLIRLVEANNDQSAVPLRLR